MAYLKRTKLPQNNGGGQDLVTFRDPVATSLQTNLQELTPMRLATGGSHLRRPPGIAATNPFHWQGLKDDYQTLAYLTDEDSVEATDND